MLKLTILFNCSELRLPLEITNKKAFFCPVSDGFHWNFRDSEVAVVVEFAVIPTGKMIY
jgi:hypothetical protein